jgi:hypothetical protein
MDGADLLHAELTKDLLVALTRLQAERRGRGDHHDVRIAPASERGEATQDDAVADLVLRAADDDDGTFGHDVACSSRDSRKDTRTTDRAVRECPRHG